MKIISWNIDSLNAALTSDSPRALLTREVIDTIISYNPDVIALQETKLSSLGPTKKHLEVMEDKFSSYNIVWNSSVEPARKGYSGTMFLYKKELNPNVLKPTIGAPTTMDLEGRIITLEFDDFYLTEVYTPNAGSDLKRLSDRQVWDEKYKNYLSELNKNKPVIAMGDFNVAHEEIDLANPSTNHFSAGFTDEERSGFTNLLNSGFIDTFRYFNKDVTGVYSWWAQRVRSSKINNSGWRIDYFLVSENIINKVKESKMLDSGTRQDHTPLFLDINI